MWFVLMILASAAAHSISLEAFNRYRVNPTVISVERDRWTWNTSFPAATVCPDWASSASELAASEKRNLEEVARGVAHDAAEYNRKRDILVEFLRVLGTASLGSLETFRAFVQNASLLPPPRLFKELFLKVQPNFTFDGSSSILSVSPPVRVIKEMGLCYSIFSHVGGVADGSRRGQDNNDILPSGNPLDGNTNAQLVQISHGYQVYFHGPRETADVAARSLHSPELHYATVRLTAVSTITTAEARDKLTVEQRKCRFAEESTEPSGVYSYNMCRTKCRADYALQLCGCVPHLFGEYEGRPVCGVDGLACLSNYEDIIIKLHNTITGKKLRCSCLPMCEDVNYIVLSQGVIPWPLGGSLEWGLTKYPNTRYKRDVLFGFADLMGSIGGTAGFFLGCSLLTGVEVAYFSLRVLWALSRRFHRVRQEEDVRYA